MYDKLGLQIKKYLIDAQRYAYNKNRFVIGTEHIVLMMLRNKDSLISFLFSEFDYDVLDYIDVLNSLEIVRNNKDSSVTFTLKLRKVIEDSIVFASDYNSKYVFDEHLFYNIILYDSVATFILKKMGVDLKKFKDVIIDTYNWNVVSDKSSVKNFVESITNNVKNHDVNPFVGREKYLSRIKKILLKKTKNNPLLVGNAGVGKTALVEGLAKMFLTDKFFKDYEVYSLNLGQIISGTKYRGDFEKKLLDCIEFIKSLKHAILFIDEIHNIIGAGSSEGSMDAANILKPLITNSNLRVIGATTILEYNKFFVKDKALTRRFQSVFIEEPSVLETKEIILGIKGNFIDYYNVDIDNYIIDYLVDETSFFIRKRNFPDKAIDVLDCAFVEAVYNNKKTVSYVEVDKAINNISGFNFKDKLVLSDKYPMINKYLLRFHYGIHKNRNIMNVLYKGNDISFLLTELYRIFNISEEMVLFLNLLNFKEAHAFSSLIGSPKGYVGYESGGILTNHVNNFPISIIVFENYMKTSYNVKKLIDDLMVKYQYLDYMGRNVCFYNTIFIFKDMENCKNNVGFIGSLEGFSNNLVDIVITDDGLDKFCYDSLIFDQYLDKLKIDGYDIIIDNKIFYNDKYVNTFEKFVIEDLLNKSKGKYDVMYLEKKESWVFK